MSRQKIIAAPPDLTGTPMERFERLLRRIASAPKAAPRSGTGKKKSRKRRSGA